MLTMNTQSIKIPLDRTDDDVWHRTIKVGEALRKSDVWDGHEPLHVYDAYSCFYTAWVDDHPEKLILLRWEGVLEVYPPTIENKRRQNQLCVLFALREEYQQEIEKLRAAGESHYHPDWAYYDQMISNMDMAIHHIRGFLMGITKR